jgi:hypothetical protein
MTYTITKEQYNAVNNGRIDLRQVIEKLKDVVHPDLLEDLQKAEKQMHSGLEPVFRQMQAEDEEHDAHVEFVEKLYGPFPNSAWSMGEDINLLEDHPWPEATRLRYFHHWGPKPVHVPIEGKKWVDLWAAANEAMRQSGDDHHFFIEAFIPDPDKPKVLELSTGS